MAKQLNATSESQALQDSFLWLETQTTTGCKQVLAAHSGSAFNNRVPSETAAVRRYASLLQASQAAWLPFARTILMLRGIAVFLSWRTISRLANLMPTKSRKTFGSWRPWLKHVWHSVNRAHAVKQSKAHLKSPVENSWALEDKLRCTFGKGISLGINVVNKATESGLAWQQLKLSCEHRGRDGLADLLSEKSDSGYPQVTNDSFAESVRLNCKASLPTWNWQQKKRPQWAFRDMYSSAVVISPTTANKWLSYQQQKKGPHHQWSWRTQSHRCHQPFWQQIYRMCVVCVWHEMHNLRSCFVESFQLQVPMHSAHSVTDSGVAVCVIMW